MNWIIWLIFAVSVGLIVAVLVTPRVVEYVEAIEINATASSVYDATRFQADLMQWSAWPTTTGSQCRVENTDGEVGAQTVFLDKKGRRFGYQEVTRLEENRVVEFKLESKGPPHVPRLRVLFVPIRDDRTEVIMHFENAISAPFHLFLRLFGVVNWTREMHKKDLNGLKRFCEPSHEQYNGKPALLRPR
ncbi:MAG: SRPBCC family protein [Pseudomonadota bacterium]